MECLPLGRHPLLKLNKYFMIFILKWLRKFDGKGTAIP